MCFFRKLIFIILTVSQCSFSADFDSLPKVIKNKIICLCDYDSVVNLSLTCQSLQKFVNTSTDKRFLAFNFLIKSIKREKSNIYNFICANKKLVFEKINQAFPPPEADEISLLFYQILKDNAIEKFYKERNFFQCFIDNISDTISSRSSFELDKKLPESVFISREKIANQEVDIYCSLSNDLKNTNLLIKTDLECGFAVFSLCSQKHRKKLSKKLKNLTHNDLSLRPSTDIEINHNYLYDDFGIKCFIQENRHVNKTIILSNICSIILDEKYPYNLRQKRVFFLPEFRKNPIISIYNCLETNDRKNKNLIDFLALITSFCSVGGIRTNINFSFRM